MEKAVHTTPQSQRIYKKWWSIIVWSLAASVAYYMTRPATMAPLPKVTCYPPLPDNTLKVKDTPEFAAAADAIDRFLTASERIEGINGIAATVFTRDEGLIWGKGYGKLRGNESDDANSDSVDIDTRFRIASISKLFTTLTSYRLEQDGVLTMQDDVRKYIPSFDPLPPGWSNRGHKGYPTTLRMLASHTSGLGRDIPKRIDLPESFKHQQVASIVAPVICNVPFQQNKSICTAEDIMKAINSQPLGFIPATLPSYSNTGFNVLGWSNAAAYEKAYDKDISFEQLLHQTVTGPLGLDATTFVTPPPESKKHRTAVPNDTFHTDVDFGYAYNAAGGLWSTARDLANLGVALLRSANEQNDFLRPATARSMMQSVVPLYDNVHSVGTPWETNKHQASRNQPYTVHKKGGNLIGYSSMFQIIPELGFGAIILQTGSDSGVGIRSDTIRRLVANVMESKKLAAARQLAGRYGSGDTRIDVVLDDYRLRMKDVIINGENVLLKWFGLQQSTFTLWNVQGHEFRIGLGDDAAEKDPLVGCDAYWFRFDAGSVDHSGYPLDMLYFDHDSLHHPALNLTLPKQ